MSIIIIRISSLDNIYEFSEYIYLVNNVLLKRNF